MKEMRVFVLKHSFIQIPARSQSSQAVSYRQERYSVQELFINL